MPLCAKSRFETKEVSPLEPGRRHFVHQVIPFSAADSWALLTGVHEVDDTRSDPMDEREMLPAKRRSCPRATAIPIAHS
jgi:hypothetical protein